MIASFTGDGVALALASGSLAARTWIEGSSNARYHRRLSAGLSRQMRFASLAGIDLDRKSLADLAVTRPDAFEPR